MESSKESPNMFSNAELHLAYKVANAPISGFPYPHCYVQDVFPADFYAEMQRNLPDPDAMIPIEEARQVKGYKERFVLELKPEHLNSLPQPKQKFWSAFRCLAVVRAVSTGADGKVCDL